MHTAVELPGTEGAKVRESVEARVCVKEARRSWMGVVPGAELLVKRSRMLNREAGLRRAGCDRVRPS